jgi:type IV pilus assembly protein PilY1
MNKHLIAAMAVAIAVLAPRLVLGQVTSFSDNFTEASDSNWIALDGACLTAGNGAGNIPACVSDPYYTNNGTQAWVGGNTGTLPDAVGNGALRLTNGCTGSGCSNGGNFNYGFAQAGGIISAQTLSAGSGLQVTFKTFTYEGNSLGNGASGAANGKDGADGISFFILDGTKTPPYDGEFDVGAFGGSLGYTCTDEVGNDDINDHPGGATSGVRAFDGVYAGYLALGIDEFGNFLNPGDNTATGPGPYAERIGLRGSGSVNWYWLQQTYGTSVFKNSWTSTNYTGSGAPSCSFQGTSVGCTEAALAVHYTCASGYLENYKGQEISSTGQLISNGGTPVSVPDYPYITNAYTILPSGDPIANEGATTRNQATPITYSIKITQNGILSVSYSYNGGAYQQVIAPQSVQTLLGSSLPPLVRFGFAGSTGGGNNVHEIACFEAGPPAGADTSVGVNQKEASKIATGTQAFLSFYDPATWAGDVTANEVLYQPAASGQPASVIVNTAANWDASCNLTGVASGQSCQQTGQSGPITAQAPTSRVMLTWNGTQGIPFEWTSLNTTEQNTLDAGDATPYNSNRLSYLRGVRTNEINSSGTGLFRARVSVLGDVVDSSPTWVGYPDAPYANVWTDRLYPDDVAPENGSQTYGAFAGSEATRLNVVYVGSNDGFLHGFEAGSYDTNHNFVTSSPNDGKEVFAYMPGAVLQTIHNSSNPALDFSNPQYAHNFFVDATPDEDDLFYQGAWHTWVVGGLGAGGSALYALDVTTPSSFSESNDATVIGEWTPATISCSNVGSCGQNLGNTYGEPVIRRLHNGMWGVIFGNGYGSASGDAGIFIMTVDPSTGAKTFYYLSTGQSGKSDGIAYPSAADLDGDNVIDYVYAGDLKGHVWRFDLTSSNPASWAVTPAPVFTDPNGNPITTRVVAGATVVSQGSPRVILNFGTGRKVPQTATAAAQYATGTQTIYGIWDWNMSAWNAVSSRTYAYLTTGPTSITLSNLVQQKLTAASESGVYDDTSNTVCWGDGSTCSSNPQYGWYILLPNTQEQLLFNPLLYQGTLYFNTTIPPNNSPLNCNPATETGNTYAVSGTTGGVVAGLFTDFAATDANAAGENTDPSGSPFVMLAGGGAWIMTQSTATLNNETTPTTGPFACTGMTCNVEVTYHGQTGQRLTWIEKR